MIFLYQLILPLIAIILLPVIIVAFALKSKLRAGFKQKIGFYQPKEKYTETVLFHAVSVGEVNAIAELVKQYRKQHPEKSIIVTTTTKTGQEVANKSLGSTVNEITYFPYDFIFSVNSFFKAYKPTEIIIAETEIWPCFVTEAKKKGYKIFVVNGRISPHSAKGYKKIAFFLSKVFAKYEKIFMQTDYDKERIISAGAPSDKVEIMGNLKFDITPNLSEEEIDKYKQELKTNNKRVFIAASTHKGEDEIVLNIFKALKSNYPDMKLLLAPRHPQRFEQVEDLIKETGYSYGKRSEGSNFDNCEIIMLNTMGELSKLFAIAYLAYIGGSFSGTGGHNPLEANIWGVPVVCGNSTFNFKDIFKILTELEATKIANDEEQLKRFVEQFYSDENEYKKYALNSKLVFEKNRGAIDFVLSRI